MKRLFAFTAFIFTVGFIIGCGETETPTEVEVTEKVELLQPVAKLLESIPPVGSTVNYGDEIALTFTEVPENLIRTYAEDWISQRIEHISQRTGNELPYYKRFNS